MHIHVAKREYDEKKQRNKKKKKIRRKKRNDEKIWGSYWDYMWMIWGKIRERY